MPSCASPRRHWPTLPATPEPTASKVTLHAVDGRVELLVEDNGSGFEPGSTRRGLGLELVRESVTELGGELRLQSEPDRGTRFVVIVPVHEAGGR
jgi:two-component system, NarL family, sensor kinase